jgi:hypothetical protein
VTRYYCEDDIVSDNRIRKLVHGLSSLTESELEQLDELADIIYDTRKFLLRKDGPDVTGALALLDRALNVGTTEKPAFAVKLPDWVKKDAA